MAEMKDISSLYNKIIGVDIFFFISGYINTLSYLSKNDKSKVLFYLNRLKRLFPVSHLALFVSIINILKKTMSK